MLKILHFGDMHLDSPFSDVGMAAGERLREELRAVFGEIMSAASDGGYGAVLIAGDLFDCGFISPDTVRGLTEAFRDFGGPVVIAPGNHDPYTQNSVWAVTEWPENVYIFRDEHLSHFDFDAGGTPVTVWGWAFTSDRLDGCPLSGGLTPVPGRVNLICAHADISSPISKYAPTPLSALAQSGCVYAALGHIHKTPEPVFAGGVTTVSYCGVPEGRSYDEPGQGGVMSVTLTDDSSAPVIERIPTGSHRYEVTHLDVTSSACDADTASLISALCEAGGYGGSVSLKVYLEGAVTPEYTPDPARIGMLLSQGRSDPLCSLLIRDRTAPVYGAEYLADDMSIRGEFYRVLLPQLESADPEQRAAAAAALRVGLLALDGKAFM